MGNILQEIDQYGVLQITLNRPDVHNAFDSALISELTAALKEAEQDSAVRMLVLTGAGASFSAGADLHWMRSMAEASEEENEQDALQLAELMRTLNYLDRPTIALINGSAFGGGVGLVSCCDIAIASDKATFGLTETTLGLVPAVISPYVYRRIGETQARRYFMTGERFDANKAKAIGLVHEVVGRDELEETLNSFIISLLKAAPGATIASKKLINAVAGHDEEQQKQQDKFTAGLIARLRVSAEGQEGLNAFLEKRNPSWRVDS
jgi:methylglutaconyl-CoA hydratase